MTGESAAAIAACLRGKASQFRRVPLDRVVHGLAAAHAEWARANSSIRTATAAVIAEATGYPETLIDESLARLFRSMAGPCLRQWLGTSFGHGQPPAGPTCTLVIGSGNIPGASLPSVVQALLLRSPVLAKLATNEPVLMPAYLATLQDRAPDVAAHLAVAGWPGGNRAIEAAVFAEMDAIVAYGSDQTLADLQSRIGSRTRLIRYGAGWSCAAVAREVLTRRRLAGLARRVGQDFAAFDQQGCLSPQALYTEVGGVVGPHELAAAVAQELARLSVSLPRHPLAPDEAAEIHRYRAAMELRALGDAGSRLWTGAGWTVAVDPEPQPVHCPLNRTVIIKPITDLSRLPETLRGGPRLISVTLGAGALRFEALSRLLRRAGFSRVAGLGQAQAPTGLLCHDGFNGLAALAGSAPPAGGTASAPSGEGPGPTRKAA